MEAIKIGYNLNTSDKNSGAYEYYMLKEAVSDIDCNDFVLVINGVGNEDDILKDKRKKIFAITDSFAFKENKATIDAADVILHQSKRKLDFIRNEQGFNFIPFLFAVNCDKPVNQMDAVIFGGANTRRDDKIAKFFFDESGKMRKNVLCLLKKYNGSEVVYDDRVDYIDFRKMLRRFKYTVCFSRKEYDELEWITSRYIESATSFVFPFTDSKYFVYGDLESKKVIVDDYDDMMRKMIIIEESRFERILEINKIINSYKDSFKETVIKYIS